MSKQITEELQKEYDLRFSGNSEYRNRVWKILTRDFFQKYVPRDSAVLDLGCGWGEFINNIEAGQKYGMDLNPSSEKRLKSSVVFIHQDCSEEWNLEENSLDVVFTSNFLEHLPDKKRLRQTICQVRKCLKTGGAFICMGPNIRYLPGSYWDFWDHQIALTDLSLKELLEINELKTEVVLPRFLPYTMANKTPPLLFFRIYLRLPLSWKIFGRQFLVVARKTS